MSRHNMIKVSAGVCETLVSQIRNMPAERTEAILNQIRTENPEFVQGVSDLFEIYIEKNGIEDTALIGLLGINAALFSLYAWKLIQTQTEVDELRSMMG